MKITLDDLVKSEAEALANTQAQSTVTSSAGGLDIGSISKLVSDIRQITDNIAKIRGSVSSITPQEEQPQPQPQPQITQGNDYTPSQNKRAQEQPQPQPQTDNISHDIDKRDKAEIAYEQLISALHNIISYLGDMPISQVIEMAEQNKEDVIGLIEASL